MSTYINLFFLLWMKQSVQNVDRHWERSLQRKQARNCNGAQQDHGTAKHARQKAVISLNGFLLSLKQLTRNVLNAENHSFSP